MDRQGLDSDIRDYLPSLHPHLINGSSSDGSFELPLDTCFGYMRVDRVVDED